MIAFYAYYFKDKYDVVIIGGALSGLSSALKLLEKGKDVLVALEKSCLKHDSSCRSVRCGYCHIKVIRGDYFLLDDSYIRHAEKN